MLALILPVLAGVCGAARAEPVAEAWNAAHAAAHYQYVQSRIRSYDEAAIRSLEEEERLGELHRDVGALSRLWSEGLVTNATAGEAAISRNDALRDLRLGRARLASLRRNIETIYLEGDMAIVVGGEMAQTNSEGAAFGFVQRRFTHVWVKDSGKWSLLVRHVSVASLE